MKKFTDKIIIEGKLATDFEALIVCAYNGGPSKDPGVLKVNHISVETYKEHEKAAVAIAKTIKTKIGAKGKMSHYGKGAGKLTSWWNGRSTPKTDIYIGTTARISLKEAGGSQLLSAKKGEALSTFKAALLYMDGDAPAEAQKLMNSVARTMQEIIVPPSTTIGKFTTKVRAGDKVAKNLEPLAKKFISSDKAKGRLTKQMNDFFNESITFRDWFVFEAATGFTKFSPEGPLGLPISNWVVKFDTAGKVHECARLMTAKGKPTVFTRKMAGKVKFRISWKTPTSKGKKTFLSLRGDILKENSLDGIPTFEEIISNAASQYLTEGNDGIIDKAKKFFGGLLTKVLNALKAAARKGINGILAFLGMEPSNVSVSGMVV